MGIQDIAAGIGSSGALDGVAARLGMSPEQAQTALHGVLEHVSEGGSVDSAAEVVAERSGLDTRQVQALLPSVMALLQSHTAHAPEGDQATLASLIGSLQSGVLSELDQNKDGSILDDAWRIARRLFGGRDVPPG